MKIKIIKKNEDGYNPEADCRICFEYKSTTSNPKFEICKCKNSLIHIDCLKEQFKPKENDANQKNSVTSYKWEKFNCEVCQAHALIYLRIQREIFLILWLI